MSNHWVLREIELFFSSQWDFSVKKRTWVDVRVYLCAWGWYSTDRNNFSVELHFLETNFHFSFVIIGFNGDIRTELELTFNSVFWEVPIAPIERFHADGINEKRSSLLMASFSVSFIDSASNFSFRDILIKLLILWLTKKFNIFRFLLLNDDVFQHSKFIEEIWNFSLQTNNIKISVSEKVEIQVEQSW